MRTGEGESDVSFLSPDLWFGGIRVLETRLSSEPDALEPALRHAYHLTLIAAPFLESLFHTELDEQTLEQLLDNGRFLEAATQITASSQAELRMSIPDGHAEVTIVSERLNASGEATDTETARAILLAWLRFMLAIEKKAVEAQLIQAGPVRRKPPRERHRRSNAH